MSTVLTRFSLLGAAVSLLLAGCGTGPSQAGSAVIIGDTAIPLEQVQARLGTVLKREPAAKQAQEQGKLDFVSRLIVTDIVQHEVLKKAAEREGIVIDETAIDQVIENAGGPELASRESIQDPSNIRDYQRDLLIRVELGRRYVDKLEVTFDYFYAKDGKEAVAKAKEVAANPAKMAEFVRDAPKNPEGARLAETRKSVRLAETPSQGPMPHFGVQPGTVVAFVPDQAQAQWMVALVHDRKSDGRATNDPSSAQLDPRTLAGIGLRAAQALASGTDIKVNPRYGAWDSASFSVAESEDHLTGYVGAVRKTAP